MSFPLKIVMHIEDRRRRRRRCRQPCPYDDDTKKSSAVLPGLHNAQAYALKVPTTFKVRQAEKCI